MASVDEHFDFDGEVLEDDSRNVDVKEMIKQAHPDHGGSKEELQRALEIKDELEEKEDEWSILEYLTETSMSAYDSFRDYLPGFPDLGSILFFNGEDNEEELQVVTELPEVSKKVEMAEEYQKLLSIEGFNEEHAEEALEYEGNTQMARKVLETEWKIDNLPQYLDWDKFSQGSLKGDAELILSEYTEEQREELIQELIEQQSPEYGEITKTWTQEQGHLMGYSTEKGHPVKLIDSYEQLNNRIEKREESLIDMMKDAKQQIDNYGKAATKSIVDQNIERKINDQDLLNYIESRIN